MMDKIFKSSFLKFTSIVFVGNLLAQLIMMATFVGFAHFFAKEEIGIYTIFVSLSILLAVLATGRFELAVMLPKNKEDSLGLLKIALILSLIFSVLLFLILSILPLQAVFSKLDQLDELVLLLPCGVFFMAAFQSFIIYYNKQSAFKLNAFMKFLQAIGFLGFTVLYTTYFSYTATAIILAWITSQAVIFTLFTVKILSQYLAHSFGELKSLFLAYKRYPTVSLLANFVNTFSIELPNYFIPIYWGASTQTLYAYGAKVAGMPRNFIGAAIGDVFFNSSSELANHKPKELLAHLKKITKTLFLFSSGIYLIGILSAHYLFPLVFGPDYVEAVAYFQWLAFASIFLFVQSPISVISDVIAKLKAPLIFNLISIVVKVLALIFAAKFFSNPLDMIALYAGVTSLLSFTWILYLQKMTKEFTNATHSV